MKKIIATTIFIFATALNVFALSWAYEHMDSYKNPTGEVEVRDQVKETYFVADYMSLNTKPTYSSTMKLLSFKDAQSDNADLILVSLMSVFLYLWMLL